MSLNNLLKQALVSVEQQGFTRRQMNHINLLKQALASAKKKGFTRKAICNESGVTKETIDNWIAGRSTPTLIKWIAVINACGHTVEFTMRGDL